MVTDYTSVFQNKNFIYVWLSQVFSQLTLNIVNFLFLLRLFNETGSTIATSFLWISYALPGIFVLPFAAAAVDLMDRKKVLIVTNLLQSLLIFLFAVSGHTSVFLLYGVAVLYSFINQFYVPAELSTVPAVVKEGLLSEANGITFMTQQGALIFGFAAASPLLSYFGFEKTLIMCSLMLFFAFLSVTLLPIMKPQETVTEKLQKTFTAFIKSVISGYEIIRDNRFVLAPLVLLMSMQISLAVVIVNAPVLATEIFGVPFESAGLLLIMPAGMGSVFGAFILPKMLQKKMRKMKIIQNSLLLMNLILLFLIFILPEASQPQKLVVGMATLFIMGICFLGVAIPAQTFLQEKTPIDFRGRVFGNYWFLATTATVFPVILSGTITELFGIRILLLILTVGTASLLVFIKEKGSDFLANEATSK